MYAEKHDKGQEQLETKLFNEDDAPFAMSPKDLNLIEAIPKLVDTGINSLKIEGRMKSIHYVATVVSVYRKVIDAYCADPDHFVIDPEWIKELAKCANRPTAPAFFENTPGHEEQMFGNHSQKPNANFVGLVIDFDEDTSVVTLQQRNYFKQGDVIEFFGPEINNFTQRIDTIWDEKGNEIKVARHPLQIVKFKLDNKVYPQNMMRKEAYHE